MSNQQDKLRDREFDSLVAEGIENTQTCEEVENPLASAVNIGRCVPTEVLEVRAIQPRTILDAVLEAVEPFARPYYNGGGSFDTQAFFAAYEAQIGRPLEDVEVNLIALTLGHWTGTTLAKDVNAEIEQAKRNGASRATLEEIAQRGLWNALTGAGI